LTYLSNHLNGKINFRKVAPQGVLIDEEDRALMAWVLHMQQLKTKVVEFTQTRPTLFKDGLLGNNY